MRQIFIFFGLIALSLGFVFSSGPVFAQAANPICLLDGRGEHTLEMLNCPTVTSSCGDQINFIPASQYGIRMNTGLASTPVDAHGKCRYTDNTSGNGYFVPFKSSFEWEAFLNNQPDGATTSHCARPFSGQHVANHLYFGPTTVDFSMGDTGDSQTFNVQLPYWRTGHTWPPAATCANTSHTFNHSCYEEYSTYHCWHIKHQTCTGSSCAATDPKTGACTVTTTYTYDCSYCDDAGSICAKNWYNWSETFNFIATALDSDTNNPSWSGTSSRTAGTTRPTQCNTRCVFDGHDCTGCGAVSCTPTGVTHCIGARTYDSCGTDIGPCCCIYWGC